MIDRAVDAWSAWRALSGKKARVVSNIAVATTYALLFLKFRDWSNDQWYLPAGLRFAALLVAPLRLWPALFFGELAALVELRLPKWEAWGGAYTVASMVTVWPAVASIVHQLRKHTAVPRITWAGDAVALAVAAVLTAEVTSLISKATTAWLKIGAGPIKYADLIVYSLGDIQGIMLAVFVVALVYGLRGELARSRAMLIESALGILFTVAFTTAISMAGVLDVRGLLACRLVMLAPTVALTLRFGWRGAALGAVAANLALFYTTPHLDKEMSDGAALLVQEALTFSSWLLFALGARGALPPAQAANLSHSSPGYLRETPAEARERERERFNAMELQLRDQALRAEAMQSESRGRLDPIVQILRQNGQPQAAMDLIGAHHTQATQFRGDIIDPIYPLTLERDGFAAALYSDGFLSRLGNVRNNLDITGSAHGMALGTLLTSYRILCESIDYLLTCEPAALDVRVRCVRKDGRGHIRMTVTARDPAITTRCSVDTARLAGLRNRACAFEGSFHSRPHSLRVIVVDTAAVPKGIAGSPTRRALALSRAD